MNEVEIQWPILTLLPPHFSSQVKSVCIFGTMAAEFLVVTKNNQVFSFGTNQSYALGIGDQPSTFEPQLVAELSNKTIHQIAYGIGPHLMAIVGEEKELYSWGHNVYSQLGNGSVNAVLPSPVPGSISNKCIAEVACGGHHTLALTSDGQVFSWGYNNCGQVGSGTTNTQHTPLLLSSLKTFLVQQVTCGQSCSSCLTNDGYIFSWGYNGNGQLGLGNNVNQSSPSPLIFLKNEHIIKVCHGYAHTLAISQDGSLYSWGANSLGQLGLGHKTNMNTPSAVVSEPLDTIETSSMSHISVGLLRTGKIAVWGQCKSQIVTKPMITGLLSISEAFLYLSNPAITVGLVNVSNNPARSVASSLADSFNDKDTADFKFIIKDKVIYAHRAILRIRCEYFRNMMTNSWSESQLNEIHITDYTYETYHAFLQFVYTDNFNLNAEETISLLGLANNYCESELKRKCEERIKRCIDVDNAAMLLAASIKFDANQLENFCFAFCMRNMTKVVSSESFTLLDEFVIKHFIQKAAAQGAFKS